MDSWQEEMDSEASAEYYEGYKVGRNHEAAEFRLQRDRLSSSVRSAFLFGSVVGVMIGLIIANLML